MFMYNNGGFATVLWGVEDEVLVNRFGVGCFVLTGFLLVFLGFSLRVNAMSLFDFMKICVFSDVRGVVTLNGEVISGASITREAKVVFNGKEYVDTATTDKNGEFSFPVLNASSVNTVLPSAKLVNQNISISYEGKTYTAWQMVKQNYQYGGELNSYTGSKLPADATPLDIVCELSNDDKVRKAGNHRYTVLTGICRWQGELEPSVDVEK